MKKKRLSALISAAMKITIIQAAIAISFSFSCLAHDAGAQGILDKKISISAENKEIKTILHFIQEQTGIKFIYGSKAIKAQRKISVNIADQKLAQFIESVLKPLHIGFKIVDEQVLLYPEKQKFITGQGDETFDPTPLPDKPDRIITGSINDEKGKPVEGVSVSVKGSKRGTTSGANGSFRIELKDGENDLVISSTGYQTVELKLSAENNYTVILKAAINTLDEVVVVGYGTQKRRNVSSAVTSFNAEDLDERPILRVDQALVGQMSGVAVRQGTGIPGKAFTVQVRGTGSISAGNDPLYVIDGFPLSMSVTNSSGGFSTGNPLDNINPNDIQSIEVLKDAAAAAIYGSRAANGVVIITTKKGRQGTPKINLNVNAGYVERTRKLDMLSATEWIDRATEIINAQWVASGAGRTAAQTNEQRRVILGLPVGGVNTSFMTDDRWTQPGHPGLQFIDWQDETFRKGLTQNYQLSASGANENVNYYFSGNYVNQESMLKGLDYTAYSARANVELKVNKKLKFGVNIAPTYSVANDPGNVEGKEGILHHLVSLAPVQQNLPADVNVFNNDKYLWSGSFNSPVARLNYDIGLTKRFRTLATIFGELTITKGLSFKTTVNLDNTDNTSKTYIPFTVSGQGIAARATGIAGTSGTFTQYKKLTFVNENTLNYNFLIKRDHNFSALVGYAYNTDRVETSRLTSSGGFTNSVVTTLNYASAVTGNTTESKNVLISQFGRIQYNYKSKYLLTASIRRDGSSRFGVNNPFGWFPSGSAAWRVSDEKFMDAIPFISDLKVRISYGKSGNYNVGDYNDPVLGSYPYVFNNLQAIGQTASNVANPDLTWETSTTKDFGLDFGILKNRITGSVDFYTKDNTDILINSPIPAVTGFNNLLINAGHVRNKGWEIELTSRNFTGDFQWNTSFNLSHNRNKVISLVGGQNQILIPSALDINHSILRVGEPMYSIFVVKQIGILSQKDITDGAARFSGQVAGDPKYEDFDKSGAIDANDRQIVGKPNPDYIWGITNTLRYKGFDFTILVQGQTGGNIYSLFGRSINRTGTGFTDNVLGVYRDRWRSDADPGNGEIGKALQTWGRIKNTDWLYSSDYVRVRNITLGYNLDKVLKTKVQAARVYLTLENFFGHDKYKGGFNPEASNTDLSGSGSFPEAGDYGGLPLPRSLVFGINFTF